jgi:quinoprotein glucose dehydrogenase
VVFVAATDDARFRAIDAATGADLWEDRLERPGNANPLTYRGSDGRQYVAIAATDVLLTYRLP